MAGELFLLMLLSFLYQINVFGQEMNSTKMIESTSLSVTKTSVEITSIASEKQTEIETTNETASTTGATESVSVTTGSNSTSIFPDNNSTTPVYDRDSRDNHTTQTINPFTKVVMIIVCITYFGLFLLCTVGVCVRKINAKSPLYSVVYSNPKNNRDDTVLLVENMY